MSEPASRSLTESAAPHEREVCGPPERDPSREPPSTAAVASGATSSMPPHPTSIAVVDTYNRFVRWTDRAEIHAARLPHRSVQVLLFDGLGRLVLQRRAATKQTHANYWDASASGHVEASDYPDPARPDDALGAVYDAVAARELEEELGVRAELERLGAFEPLEGVHYEHFMLYRGRAEGPYRAQPEEVAEVRAFSRREYDALVASGALVTRSVQWLVRWARERSLFGSPST